MEYLVREFDGKLFGVTQPNTKVPDELRVVWENGVVSLPWWPRNKIKRRYEVIRELTDEEVQKQLLVWKIKGMRFGPGI
jgi:hypothetical protein